MHNFTSMINSDLNNLRDWLKVNKLQFHLFEIKLMIIGSAYNPIQTWGGEAIVPALTLDVYNFLNKQAKATNFEFC